jgi:hypothetical protein
MAQTVNGGCINPVYAQFERTMNGRDRLGVILCAPAELPIAAYCPRTKSDGRDEKIRISQNISFHNFLYARNYRLQRLQPPATKCYLNLLFER